MNFRNLTYKQKNRYLLAGSVLFALIVYSFSVSNTIHLYSEVSKLETQLSMAASAPQKIQEAENKLGNLEGKVSGFLKPELFTQEFLLGIVSGFCQQNHLVLREFPKPALYEENDYLVETYRIVAEGSFVQLLKLAYELEQRQKAGRVASLRFQMKKDLRSRRKFLELTLYLQNIKKSNL